MEVRIEFVPDSNRILPSEGRRDRMSKLESFYVLLIVALRETSEIASESGGGFTSLIAFVLFCRSFLGVKV